MEIVFVIVGVIILVLLAIFLGYMAVLSFNDGRDYWTFVAGCMISACMAALFSASYSGLDGVAFSLGVLAGVVFFVRAMSFA